MKEYDALAPYYDRFMSFFDYDGEAWALKAFFSALYLDRWEILDLGAGSGGHLLPLVAAGMKVSAVDLSEAMVARLREKLIKAGLDTPVYIGDMRRLTLEEGRFAAAYSWGDTVHHLTSETDLTDFFASVRRVLRPDGYLLFNWRKPAYFEDLIDAGAFYETHGEDFLLWEAEERASRHCLLRLNGFIKVGNGEYKRVGEDHLLRIWREEELCAAGLAQGFSVEADLADSFFNAAEAEEGYGAVLVLKKEIR